MKYAPLVVRNVFRNRVRSILTICLMAAIFFFVATLMSILVNFEQSGDIAGGRNRLGVQSAVSLGVLMPVSHEAKIRNVPGVTAVAKLQWVAAYYRDKKNFFPNFAVDHEKFEIVWDDYRLDAVELEAFQSDRQGAIVGSDLASRFGWKIGDRVNLTGTIFPFDPQLTIRGIYDHTVDNGSLYFHMDYFQKSLADPGMTQMFWLRVDDAANMDRVSEQIDDTFRNSDYPTETFTEKEFQKQFISMIGDIKLLFTTVSICAVFMVILVGAITMSMSARERVTEIAVLKAIGFRRNLVLTMMLAEFMSLSLFGGLIGIGGAMILYHYMDMTQLTRGFLVNFGINPFTVAACIAVAVMVGLIAGGLPAYRSTSIPVVDGLRKVV
jgi:putative ABC transport system permease protein